eukprot:GHVR01119712.1.p1 GENE.GHVR01119712.1~~GHVR01119712.1.p1  ORF type:complete len:102 (-),score=35.03 GHVR01119712.1:85-390(-)
MAEKSIECVVYDRRMDGESSFLYDNQHMHPRTGITYFVKVTTHRNIADYVSVVKERLDVSQISTPVVYVYVVNSLHHIDNIHNTHTHTHTHTCLHMCITEK